MGTKQTLGHIDCPTCGTAKGMRITLDKNGDPFGYCEAECNQQMRIGGDKRRVEKFVSRYPWAAGQPQSQPVPVTVTETKPEQIKPVTETPPAPAPKKKPGLNDALQALGIK